VHDAAGGLPLHTEGRPLVGADLDEHGETIATWDDEGSLWVWDAHELPPRSRKVRWHAGFVDAHLSSDGWRLLPLDDSQVLSEWSVGPGAVTHSATIASDVPIDLVADDPSTLVGARCGWGLEMMW